MAVVRREFVYICLALSITALVFLLISLLSENWVVSYARSTLHYADSELNYGLFTGQVVIRLLASPTYNPISMTCVYDVNACAPSCKTTEEARIKEVRALALGYTPTPSCTATTTIDETKVREPAIITPVLWIIIIFILTLDLLIIFVTTLITAYNAVRNPTEAVFGIAGIRWFNVTGAILSLSVLMIWGIYWKSSGLYQHLAFAYIVTGELEAVSPAFGYSYWLILGALLCCISNVALIEARRYILEREVPTTIINIDQHSDGTIFLY